MDSNREYIVLGVIVIILFFALITLSKIEAPLEELAKLPKCSKNNVVITSELLLNVTAFSNNYIKNGTGDSYFNQHYHFLNVDYSTDTCEFVVKYDYTYGTFHTPMNMVLKVFSNSDIEVEKVNAFLRPVGLLVTPKEAESLASQNNITYDYYNLGVDISYQTFVYTFYKNTLTEGKIIVFKIDAQSKEVTPFQKIPKEVPIV